MILWLLACEKESNPAPSNEAFCALVESMGGPDTGMIIALDCDGPVADVCSEDDGVLFTTALRIEAAERVCDAAGYDSMGQGSSTCLGDTGALIQTMYYDCGETVAR